MEHLPWILGVTAALLHGAGYILYNMQSKRGNSKPNVVSWSIWAFMAVLNLFSFVEITSIAHALQYVIGTFAAILTFVNAFRWGVFAKPKRQEIVIFIICMMSIVVWWWFQNASIANAIFMLAFLLSFYPTFMGVYKDPNKEQMLAWIIWTLAFSVSLANNAISWNGDAMSVLNPIILLLCHASIGWLCRNKRKQRLTLSTQTPPATDTFS